MNRVRRNRPQTLPLFAVIGALSLALGNLACGDGNSDAGGETEAERAAAFTEAAPEVEPERPSGSGELSEDERAAVESAVRAYVKALDEHDAAAVCTAFEPGALDLSELPVRRGDCAGSLAASIGTTPKRGGPAWRRTVIRELNEVSVGDDRARVTATVTHDFSDRNYVSVEEDVIYLDRSGDRWLLAKPSGTFYRAVGYPEPPLRALTPP